MSGHAGMPVLPLSELEWIGLVNEKEDVLSEPRKNGRRGVFFLDFYLSWMSQSAPIRQSAAISRDISPARMARTMASTSRCGSVICMAGGAQEMYSMYS